MTDDLEDHDRGLSHDLPVLLKRRGMLGIMIGAGLAPLVGCSSDGDPSGGSATTDTAAGGCATIPEETAGPFPADGSNGLDVLQESGVVRSDITSSFGTSSTVAEGVPLTIRMTVLEAAGSCAPMTGAAVYLWHCDRDGRYSMYDPEIADQNYLRGVQETDGDGQVTFASVFPACYSGRWPHIHFEVYPSLDGARNAANRLATSQIALPADTCATVYATDGYAQSLQTMAETSLETDMVFSDGPEQQTPAVSRGVGDGFTVSLQVPV